MGRIWEGILADQVPGIARNEAERQYKTLIGREAVNRGHPVKNDPGSGLLGAGAEGYESYYPQHLARTSALPGKMGRYARAEMADNYRQGLINEATMGRQLQQQYHDMFRGMSNTEQIKHQAGLTQNATTNQLAREKYGFEQIKWKHEQLSKVNKEYANFVLPWTEQIDSSNVFMEMMNQEPGGFEHKNATLDGTLINVILKAVKPNEQVTEGEYRQNVEGMGVGWDVWQSALTTIGQGGSLNPTTRKNLVRQLEQFTERNVNKLTEAQNRYWDIMTHGGIGGAEKKSVFGMPRSTIPSINTRGWTEQ